MRFTYYPGCASSSFAREHDSSSRATSKLLGIDLAELENWNCCGADSVRSIDRFTSVVLPVRNLALSEKTDLDLLVTCPGCYQVFSRARELCEEDGSLKAKVNAALSRLDLTYSGKARARHLLDVIVNDIGLTKISQGVKKQLTSIKAVPYYGCQHAGFPKSARFDDPQRPQTLSRLIAALGAEPVPFPSVTRCCGGPLFMTHPEAASKMTRNLLRSAKDTGGQCIVTTCELCHFNLDARQSAIEKLYGEKYSIPIVHFTQLLGLGLGIDSKTLGLDRNIVPFNFP